MKGSCDAGLTKYALVRAPADYTSKKGMIMGWGAHDDNNHEEPARLLRYLRVNLTECPSEFSGKWERTSELDMTTPEFICASAPRSIGGPCSGDDGGVHMPLPTLPQYPQKVLEASNLVYYGHHGSLKPQACSGVVQVSYIY